METHAVINSFDQCTSKEDWKSAYDLIPELIRTSPNDVGVWVRVLYTLHNIIVEEGSTKLGLDVADNQLEQELLNYFKQANEKFADNAEYLFFMGKIGHIAEWYWGENDDDFASKMSAKALQIEPQNKLYECATLSPRRNKVECERLVSLTQSVLNDPEQKMWLEKRGFPGRYILQIFEFQSKYRCTDEGMMYPIGKNADIEPYTEK